MLFSHFSVNKTFKKNCNPSPVVSIEANTYISQFLKIDGPEIYEMILKNKSLTYLRVFSFISIWNYDQIFLFFVVNTVFS